ncbi:MAG TPA: protein kinase [Aggregatilineales bacterium]|nr:protein kinase [Aggregatilineales bacterium]
MKNRKIGKYEIIERLGRGGMAEVYRAYHANLDRYVAVKVMHKFLADDDEFATRFEKEAQNIARLKHPNIVQVYDFEYDNATESYYMVMELIDGVTLKEYLADYEKKGVPLPLEEALRISREAASALSYAHRAGMIHRDVKPANLMLDSKEGHRVVLTDFGIAKIVKGSQMTVTGGLVGTPAYMSPEQGVGETGDERSDLYSLGIIMFQMVTGDLPYDAETPLALIMKHLNDPVPSVLEVNPKLPQPVDEVISRLMSKEPEGRYATAGDLIEDIRQLEAMLSGNIAPLNITTPTERLKLPKATNNDFDVDSPTLPLRKVIVQSKPTPTVKNRKPNGVVLWLMTLAFALTILIGGYVVGANAGIFPSIGINNNPDSTPQTIALVDETEEPTPTSTDDPITPTAEITTEVPVVIVASNTPVVVATTVSPTRTGVPSYTPRPNTPTFTPTNTPTETATSLPTETFTPSITPNMTLTLAVEQTATYAACVFDYTIVDQTPKDGREGGFFRTNTDYTRTLTLLNTGTCGWEVNTSLRFITGSGESFGFTPVLLRETVEVGGTVELDMELRLPAVGSQEPISGQWQLRTRGQISIGEPITISILVADF